jgi:branched-chain amino acid transport system permease protein
MAERLGRHWRWIVLALLVLAPLLLGGYATGLLSEILITGIFALSLDLLIGFTGLISFGHALFFGLGAYSVVILAMRLDIDVLWCIPAAIAIAASLGALIGALCTRSGGVTFLMLTMAFGQLFYALAIRWRDVTGGSDGLGGFDLPDIGPWSLSRPEVMYWFILPFFALSYAALSRLVASPLGQIFIGIQQNETRMRAIGYPVHLYKITSFTIAAGFAGLAGALFAIFSGFISADVLYWTRSGEALVMVVLGGVGTLTGPVLGAAIFLLAKNLVSSWTSHWLLAVGVGFVAAVLFRPRGLIGRRR